MVDHFAPRFWRSYRSAQIKPCASFQAFQRGMKIRFSLWSAPPEHLNLAFGFSSVVINQLIFKANNVEPGFIVDLIVREKKTRHRLTLKQIKPSVALSALSITNLSFNEHQICLGQICLCGDHTQIPRGMQSANICSPNWDNVVDMVSVACFGSYRRSQNLLKRSK